MTFTFRPYQDGLLDKIQIACRQHVRVAVQSPTGSGKGSIIPELARRALERGNGAILLAHRLEICRQLSARLTEFGVRHGMIMPDRYETSWPCQVAMVATLANRLDRIAKPRLLLIDECHHATAGTYRKIAEHWEGVHTIGFTASPARLDGRGLDDCFDTLVTGPTVRWLIDQGYLAPFRYIAPPIVADLSGLKSKMGDYATAGVVDAMDRTAITGDVEAHYREFLNGKPAIAFCASVEHARRVAAEFNAKGWRAASVDGAMCPDERTDTIASIGDGRLNVLTSCDLISEGLDIPVVQGAILLRPTQSLALFLQQVGRVLRPKPDGSAAVILDHVGNVTRHGLPDFRHKWTLEGKRRNKNFRAPATRTCTKCFLVFAPAPKCPDCGFEFPALANRGLACTVPIKPGQLQELSGDWLKQGDLRDVLRSATTREQIDMIRRARGYHPNWTNVQWQLRQGFRNGDSFRASTSVRRFG